MDKHIKDWVEALRSGNYKQTEGTLKGTDEEGDIGFCCLGVFCEINSKKVPTATLEPDGCYNDEGPTEFYDFCRATLPCSVVESGIDMNDNGKTFGEIADMIENYYKEMGQHEN